MTDDEREDRLGSFLYAAIFFVLGVLVTITFLGWHA